MRFVLGVAWLVAACGPSSTPSGWAGVYDATFSAEATYSLPEETAPGTLSDFGVLTVTDEGEGTIRMVFAIRDLPRVEQVLLGLSGDLRQGTASGTHCFVAQQMDGSTRTTCCEQCTATLDGQTLTQRQVGRFHTVTTDGTNYAGTYVGTWTGSRR
jgi:hypothetical protein